MAPTFQVILFVIVGVLTTAIDFAIFNLLTGRRFRWNRIPSNLVSVSMAMLWSFLANWFVVFQPEGNAWLERAGRFLITTAFSAFILQNAVLYLTTYVWKWPSTMVLLLIRRLAPARHLDDDVVTRNTCKVMAVSAGLIWNFSWYKFFVYVDFTG